MRRYAYRTAVPRERSLAEIERLLMSHGATDFARATSRLIERIGFRAHDRNIVFVLPLPDLEDKKLMKRPRYNFAKPTDPDPDKHAAEIRRRWRALLLCIKAKLEAVESGIASFEQEFLPYTVVPGTGRTVAELVGPGVAEAYRTGRFVPLLPEVGSVEGEA